MLKVTQLEVTHQDNFSSLMIIKAIIVHVTKYMKCYIFNVFLKSILQKKFPPSFRKEDFLMIIFDWLGQGILQRNEATDKWIIRLFNFH